MVRETVLYLPVKEFLEARGYTVKSEVQDCDVVAVKDAEPVVVVELKLTFSMDLVLQGIQRQNITDDVYVAVRAPDTLAKHRNWRSRQRDYKKLCRRLGLGLMIVNPDTSRERNVNVLVDPGPYVPRKSKRQKTRLMLEFAKRTGDPNTGGSNRTRIITAYRQDALRCAMALNRQGSLKVVDIRAATGVEKAGSILQRNHYGWFERIGRGVYRLSEAGEESLTSFSHILTEIDGKT